MVDKPLDWYIENILLLLISIVYYSNIYSLYNNYTFLFWVSGAYLPWSLSGANFTFLLYKENSFIFLNCLKLGFHSSFKQQEQEREREKEREIQFPLFWFERERKDIL